MLKRLVRGLFEGAVPGLAIALLLSSTALGFTAPVAYVAAALVGAITGLVAGTPVWRDGAKVEGGLKAVICAFIATVVLFGTRKWVGLAVDLGALTGGRGAIGELPRVALPLIGVAIAWVLEIDDAFGPDPAPIFRQRVEDRAPVVEDEARASPPEQRARHEG
jgi:hypothetical protein